MAEPITGQSTDPNVPGVSGENTAEGGQGVRGQSKAAGVVGIGETWHGVTGLSSSTSGGAGVYGASEVGPGIIGESKVWHAVFGKSESTVGGAGVWAENQTGGPGVVGLSKTWHGTYGKTDSTTGGAGVCGEHTGTGAGVLGQSDSGRGVAGVSKTWQGVYGSSDSQAGVVGESNSFDGVFGISHSNQHAAVSGHNTAGGMAGFFDGNVVVTGDVTLTGADFAEEFDILEATDVESGTVMVLDQHGALRPSQQAYDKKVMGVISGAGDYKPGLILDKKGASEGRMPVALVGKVYCKVDAQYAPIEMGDLLTTSATPGHAMKAVDLLKAFGAVIGKALYPLEAGQGLIPVLVALQ